MPSPSALDIARSLIAFPSVTPADAGALPWLRDLLAGAGFAAELVTFAEAGTPDVLNLYARYGTRSAELRLRRAHRRRAGRTTTLAGGSARSRPRSPRASSGDAAPAT